jgi:hypothetical protein
LNFEAAPLGLYFREAFDHKGLTRVPPADKPEAMNEPENRDILLILPPCIGHPHRFDSLGVAYLVAALRRAGLAAGSVNLSRLFYQLDRDLYHWTYDQTSLESLYPKGVWGDDPAYLERLLRGRPDRLTLARLAGFADLAAEKIRAAAPRVVGMSVLQSNVLLAAMIAKRLQRAAIPVLAGGPAAWEPHLQAFLFRHGVRCIVTGEAEVVLPRLVGDYRRARRLPPVGTIVAGQPVPDLDSLPFPDFDSARGLGWMPVAASRGCVCRCHFCEESRFFAGIRWRTPSKVVDEIEHNRDRFCARGVQFHDSLINFDDAWLERLCRQLQERLCAFEWQAFARPVGLPGTLLERIRQSGCTALHFGIEHFSQRMSEALGKNLDVADAERVIERTAAHGVTVKVLIITGVPGETEEDHRANLAALERLMRRHPKFVDFAANPLMVTPHSLYFRRPEKFGIRLRRDRRGRVVECRYLAGPDPDTILRRLGELLDIKPPAAPGREGAPAAFRKQRGPDAP